MFLTPPVDLTREIQTAAGDPPRPGGHTVAATTGDQDQGAGQTGEDGVTPLYQRSIDDLPDREHRGVAMRGSANDYWWRQQSRFEVGAARETTASVVVEPGGILEIDPSLAITWRAVLQGDCTLVLLDDQGAPDFDPEMPAQTFTTHIVLTVSRAPGAKIDFPVDFRWPQDLVDPERLVAPDPAAWKTDTFTFARLPPSGVEHMPTGVQAMLAGRGFDVRTTVLTAQGDDTPDVS